MSYPDSTHMIITIGLLCEVIMVCYVFIDKHGSYDNHNVLAVICCYYGK